MRTLHVEGTLPHQGIHDQSKEAMKDFRVAHILALAWRGTGEKRYLDRVGIFLQAWANTYVPSSNPIDETKFDSLIDAYVLTKHDLSPPVRQAMEDLLRALARGHVARSDAMAYPRTDFWFGNGQSHRVKLVAMSAVSLNDPGLFADARRLFFEQLDGNVLADGSVVDFEVRDALGYVVYDLEPLTRAALAAKLNGEDWFHKPNKRGKSLADALDWLLPYAEGQKSHEEFVHTRVSFDKIRKDAGLEHFSGLWDAAGSRYLYWSASLLDKRYDPIALKLGGAPIEWTACWGLGLR